jgi:hypothetical protein
MLRKLARGLILAVVPLSACWAEANDVKIALAQNRHIGCWRWTSWGEGPLPKEGGTSKVFCFLAGGQGVERATGCCDAYEARFNASVRNDGIDIQGPYSPEPSFMQVLDIDEMKMEVKGGTYRLLCRVEGMRESCTNLCGFSRF